jgi:hypothetical protein
MIIIQDAGAVAQPTGSAGPVRGRAAIPVYPPLRRQSPSRPSRRCLLRRSPSRVQDLPTRHHLHRLRLEEASPLRPEPATGSKRSGPRLRIAEQDRRASLHSRCSVPHLSADDRRVKFFCFALSIRKKYRTPRNGGRSEGAKRISARSVPFRGEAIGARRALGPARPPKVASKPAAGFKSCGAWSRESSRKRRRRRFLGSRQAHPRSKPPLQPFFLISTITPNSADFVFPSETSKPSAANPRRSNSRTAAARLGM